MTATAGERSRVRPHEPALQHLFLFLFLLAFRILNAFTLRTFFQPDEYFQSLEPAWQLAFGPDSGAWLTWVRADSLLAGVVVVVILYLADRRFYLRSGKTNCVRRCTRCCSPRFTALPPPFRSGVVCPPFHRHGCCSPPQRWDRPCWPHASTFTPFASPRRCTAVTVTCPGLP